MTKWKVNFEPTVVTVHVANMTTGCTELHFQGLFCTLNVHFCYTIKQRKDVEIPRNVNTV